MEQISCCPCILRYQHYQELGQDSRGLPRQHGGTPKPKDCAGGAPRRRKVQHDLVVDHQHLQGLPQPHGVRELHS